MLPSLGLNEILVLGVLALVVIGPKDLPLLLRKLGRWTAKLRGMAQEFRTGFDELARQAELDELKKEVEALRRTTNLNSLANEITSPAAKTLPTLEDYAGLSATVSPPSSPPDAMQPANVQIAGSRGDPEAEEGLGEEGRAGTPAPDQFHAPHPPSPSPARDREAIPPTQSSPAAERPVGGGGEDERLAEPLVRSAP